MHKLILHILLFLLPLQLSAFVEVKNGQFYSEGSPWRAIGVNLDSKACEKEVFQAVAKFGWNSVRVAPTSEKQLHTLVKWAKREGVKLCVVVNSDWSSEALKSFKNKREIWAWEVATSSKAKQLKAVCPHHLITLSFDAQHTNLQAYADDVMFSQHVDFLSITLLPVESKWVAPSNLYLGLRNAYLKSDQLVLTLTQRMRTNTKPIVVSACSYPRDKMFRLPGSLTSLRDSYFDFVMNYSLPNQGGHFNGVFFQKWELLPTRDDESYLTSWSIYPDDTTTQQILIKQSK